MKIFNKIGLALLMLLASSASFAVTEPEVATAATDLVAKIGDYAGTFLPTAAAVALGFVALKWVKKFISKAS